MADGLCECGCEQRTGIARQTSRRNGHVKGEPYRFVAGHQSRLPRSPERLRELYVEEDRGFHTPCWLWTRSLGSEGYGQITVWRAGRRTMAKAHRYVYELLRGAVPSGFELDHLCRVRACVRPDHLEVVVHVENVRRGARTKLTPALVREIRRLRGSMRQRDIAQQLGIKVSSVADVHAGRKWVDVA